MNESLEALKARADLLEISYSPNIGEQALRKKIKEHDNAEEAAPVVETPKGTASAQFKENLQKLLNGEGVKQENALPDHKIKQQARNRAARLVRVAVTCMNPNKGEWDGEFIAGSNDGGTQNKFVPFGNTPTHLPQIIVNVLEERQYQAFRTKTLDNGDKVREGYLAKEFAINYLANLSDKEIEDLKKEQAISNRLQD